MATTIDIAVFTALADTTRRAILERLAAAPCSVGEVAAGLPVSRPAISQHLKILRTAGLVRETRSGRHVIYRIDPAALAGLSGYAAALTNPALPAVEADINDDIREWKALWPDIDPLEGMLVTWLRNGAQILDGLLSRAAIAHHIGSVDIAILGILHRIGAPHESTPTNLSRISRSSLPGMTQRLNSLEAMGLITRETALHDGRSRAVRLSPRGSALLQLVVREQFADISPTLAGLNDAERLLLAGLLRKLLRSLQAGA